MHASALERERRRPARRVPALLAAFWGLALASGTSAAAEPMAPRLVAARSPLEGTRSTSPDGRYTAVASARELRVYEAGSGLEVASFDDLDLNGARMAWAPDGAIVVVGARVDSRHSVVAGVAVLSVEQNRVRTRRMLSASTSGFQVAVGGVQVTIASTAFAANVVDVHRLRYPDLDDTAPSIALKLADPVLSPDAEWVVGSADGHWHVGSVATGQVRNPGPSDARRKGRPFFIPGRPVVALPIEGTPACDGAAVLWDLSRGEGETWCDFPHVSQDAIVRVSNDVLEVEDGGTLWRRALRRGARTERSCEDEAVSGIMAEWSGERRSAEEPKPPGTRQESASSPRCFVAEGRPGRRADEIIAEWERAHTEGGAGWSSGEGRPGMAPAASSAPADTVLPIDDVQVRDGRLEVTSRDLVLRWAPGDDRGPVQAGRRADSRAAPAKDGGGVVAAAHHVEVAAPGGATVRFALGDRRGRSSGDPVSISEDGRWVAAVVHEEEVPTTREAAACAEDRDTREMLHDVMFRAAERGGAEEPCGGGWLARRVLVWSVRTREVVIDEPGTVFAFSPDKIAVLRDAVTVSRCSWFEGSFADIAGRRSLPESYVSCVRPPGRDTSVVLREFDLRGEVPVAGAVHSEHPLPPPLGEASRLTISPDGRWAIALFPANTSTAGLRSTWSTLQRRTRVVSWALATAEPPVSTTLDGKAIALGFLAGHVVVAERDGFVRVLDPTSLRLELTLALVGDSGWVALTPAGHFDGTRAARSALHWVIDGEAVALEQLADRFYEPHLVDKVLGYLPDPLRDVGAVSSVRLHPAVAVKADADRRSLRVRLRDRGGGLGRVQVFVNGKELHEDARARGAGDTFEVDLAAVALRSDAENVIRVVPWNAEGSLAGRGFLVRVPPAAERPRRAGLLAIVAGVSDYAAPELGLRFAAKDAADFGEALRIAAEGLLGADRVDVRVLAGRGRGGRTSKAEVRRAFEDLARRAGPEDLLVVYLAGHGVVFREEREDYAWLTEDAGSTDLADRDKRAAWAVTGEEITAWTKAIPATKQVLVLDTCAAGALQARLTQPRSVPGDQLRAIERLQTRTGFFVLMGSASDAVSYEASRYGQGLLTYALLEGMRGPALLEDGQVDVSRLFQYAADAVPRLARNVGGVQQPRVASPSGTSFPIGLLPPAARARIPLALPRPVLLRPMLQDRAEGYDALDLAPRLARALRTAADASAARIAGGAVYVAGDELPGAIRVSGLYTRRGASVSVNLVLRRDDEVIARPSIRGSTSDLDGLAEAAAAAVLQQAAGSPARRPAEPRRGSRREERSGPSRERRRAGANRLHALTTGGARPRPRAPRGSSSRPGARRPAARGPRAGSARPR